MSERLNDEWFPGDVDAYIAIEAGVWAGADDLPSKMWPAMIDSDLMEWLLNVAFVEGNSSAN